MPIALSKGWGNIFKYGKAVHIFTYYYYCRLSIGAYLFVDQYLQSEKQNGVRPAILENNYLPNSSFIPTQS